MKTRYFLFTTTVVATLIIATGFFDDATAESSDGGFKLIKTDAAYVDWAFPTMTLADGYDDCGLNLNVGYVKAKKLKHPLTEKGHPHSDLAATLEANCPQPQADPPAPATFSLEGVLPLLPTPGDCMMAPTISKLDTAGSCVA